jgi:hypothetical protein
MHVRRAQLRATLLSVCLGLTACGGDGGGSVASTPTPPPPAGANANLLDPLKSETFANDAAQATLTVASSGAVSGSAAPATATFVYDASLQTYTMTVGSASHSFGPGDVDAALTNSAQTVYETKSGNTTDSLTVTKPGTSGRFTYEYVGAAFWQSTTINSGSSGNGALYALAYGEPTPSTATPTTGQAQYGVDLIGAYSYGNQVNGITGQGTVQVDFAQGALVVNGLLDSSAGSFAGYGKLSSTGAFSGTFDVNALASMTGTVNGRLYGPQAQEIGGTFSATDGTNIAAGAIIGRQETPTPTAGDFSTISGSQILGADQVSQSGTAAGKIGTMDVALVAGGNGDILGLFTKDYTYAVQPSGIWPAQETGSLATVAAASNGAKGAIFIPTGTPYVQVGAYYDNTGATPYADTFTFGFDTPDAAVPRTGFAGYVVSLQGLLTPAGGQAGVVYGSGVVDVAFGTGAVTTSGSLTKANSTIAVGNLAGTGTLSSSANAYSGTLGLTGTETLNGNFQGRFYGPSAQDTGAVFAASGTDGTQLTGAMTGAVDSSLIDPATTLANLSARTSFSAPEALFANVPNISPGVQTAIQQGISQITFDPTTSTYSVVASTTGYNPGYLVPVNATLSPANLDTSQTSATFTVYTDANQTTRIFNTGAGNPAIQLTYVSFADVTQTAYSSLVGNSYATEHYLVFGLQTSAQAMPISGTASYSGVVYGSGAFQQSGGAVTLAGTGQMTANFGTSAFTSTLALNITPTGGVAQSLGNIAYTGTISASTFGGGYTDGAFSQGYMAGAFYGPVANEVGAAFNLNLVDAANARNNVGVAGVFVGKKN